MNIQRFASPARTKALIDALLLPCAVLAVLFCAAGLYYGLFQSPKDYQQGETVRIMYIHVPAAWMALMIYVSMAVAAFIGLVWRHVMAELYTRAAAPLGACFTLMCLVTGSLWGKPMWGTWWVWDARLTSVLILFFFYIGYLALVDAFDDAQKGINAGAMLVLAGVINIPVIKFSVEWWNTLHQGESIFRADGPTIDGDMLRPLFLMAAGFTFFFASLVCLRLKTAWLLRKRQVRDLQELSA